MDDIVKAAMAKWPNVPDCYGWLGLDARGRWWMRDDRAQAAGPFAGPQATRDSRGTELRHDKLIGFIGRNYSVDAEGNWFFQNGPQRVYVELELAPWVWRLLPDGSVRSHTDEPTEVIEALLDEAGRLYLVSPRGVGVVHSQDMHLAADAVEQGRWQPRELPSAELPARYGFALSPSARRASASSAIK